jgi:benzoyl-CoA reductase/2-hydroxyglutaryl-CoA dehydratase subunit BcrC/BadD/HgdB
MKKKTIIYTCPYVPAEWIAAHGFCPKRIIPKAADSSIIPMEGVCPYVQAFVSEVTTGQEAAAVVMTTVCDQMRRAFDIVANSCKLPVFLMNMPSTWQHVGAKKLYLEELKRFGRFMVTLGGKSPSDKSLAEIMLEYDNTRSSIPAMRNHLTSRRYSQIIASFNRNGKEAVSLDLPEDKPLMEGTPLAIIGGPMLKESFSLFDEIESYGGRIVLDATETGERGMCGRFDMDKHRDDPLEELANTYFRIPDISRRPNSQLYDWLGDELAGRSVHGIIFRRYIWCDMWHAELYRLKKWTELPVLDIDVDGNEKGLSPRTTQRIEAFMEMLR